MKFDSTNIKEGNQDIMKPKKKDKPKNREFLTREQAQKGIEKGSEADRDSLVIQCIAMRLSEARSLIFMKVNGYPLQKTQFYRIKAKMKGLTVSMANHLALENGLIEQHMDRIRSLETIEREHWNNYHLEKDALKKSSILVHITQLQVYISSAHDFTAAIITKQAQLKADVLKSNIPQLEKLKDKNDDDDE